MQAQKQGKQQSRGIEATQQKSAPLFLINNAVLCHAVTAAVCCAVQCRGPPLTRSDSMRVSFFHLSVSRAMLSVSLSRACSSGAEAEACTSRIRSSTVSTPSKALLRLLMVVSPSVAKVLSVMGWWAKRYSALRQPS